MQVKIDHTLDHIHAHVQGQFENLAAHVVGMVRFHHQLLDVVDTS